MAQTFPPHFLWGAATAAQHVEGENLNCDWSAWEEGPGKIKNGDSSRVACDWWVGERWREDFDNARALGMNAQRISIEWARLEPRPGEWDTSAAAKYRSMLVGLRERGMEPFVTLHHFTSPQWVADLGGFENPVLPQWAARWADRAVREFGDLVKFWITVNEPNVYAYQCYLSGEWLAQKQDLRAMGRVMQNAVRAHAAMYHAVKRVQPGAQIGLALHWRTFDPLNPRSLPDRFAAALRTRILDEFILTAVQEGRFELPFALNTNVPEAQGTLDFLGLNYYFQEYTAFDPSHTREGLSRSVFDPDVAGLVPYFATVGNVRPDALRRTLVRLGQYHMPLYITENGFFETDCDDQSPYLVSHLQATLDAIQQGADVRGYFWWTLVDNFEWSEGYTPRFGLYRCDRATQARTPKPVAEVYARIIRANGIPDELSETYGRPK